MFDYPTRLRKLRGLLDEARIDALLITPGANLRYLVGYDAMPLERLTCLIARRDGDPLIVVPELERWAAAASPLRSLGIATRTWSEEEDPYDLVRNSVEGARRIAVDERMPVAAFMPLEAAIPGVEWCLGDGLLPRLRAIKSKQEIESLRDAANAVDRVHARMGEWLRARRTEREVARDIAMGILTEGHEQVDYVIVASGPNAGSPHHLVSDRMIKQGEPIVVDIGGRMPSGYHSDSTRTYSFGEPLSAFRDYYAILMAAQQAAFAQVSPGISAEAIDGTARQVISDAGYGEHFIHRLGHGIGLEPHEKPYLVHGNGEPVVEGMVFSVEPGIYFSGQHGARIEDIVVCTGTGAERLNNRPRDLIVL